MFAFWGNFVKSPSRGMWQGGEGDCNPGHNESSSDSTVVTENPEGGAR